jgi:hypothetical protein
LYGYKVRRVFADASLPPLTSANLVEVGILAGFSAPAFFSAGGPWRYRHKYLVLDRCSPTRASPLAGQTRRRLGEQTGEGVGMDRKNRYAQVSVLVVIGFVCLMWSAMATVGGTEPAKAAAILGAMASLTGAAVTIFQAIRE